MDQTKILTASPVQGEAVVLNEDTYNSLYTMLKSNDPEDHRIAQLILNTCDIVKSIYWIWKLSKTVDVHRMVNLRTKASRAFRDISRLFFIYQKSDRMFVEFLCTQKWITPEIYQKLENNIIQNTLRQCNNKFYDVTLVIKDDYKYLVSNVEPIKENND